MRPNPHTILGFLFAGIIYLFIYPITIFQASLIFLSSVLIDFDHYIWYVLRKKDWSLKNAYNYLIDIFSRDHKPVMMVIHTVEFHILTGLLIFFWNGFFFILIGMLFHSLLDVVSLARVSNREFSLIKYLISDKLKYL